MVKMVKGTKEAYWKQQCIDRKKGAMVMNNDHPYITTH
jgi:hypothetical protein